MVAWAIRQGVALAASPDAVAHELASANRAAFAERYQGRYQEEVAPFGGLDRSAGVALAPVAIVKACDCLDYQASDWSSWDRSTAAAHLAAIRSAALESAAGALWKYCDVATLPGYDAAAWCLDEVTA